jgi:hypothetical protein
VARIGNVEGQGLTAEDELFVLMEAGLYLTATRGFPAPDALSCYVRAESLCVSLGSTPGLVFRTERCVALFPRYRQAKCNDADSQTSLLTGAGPE